MKRAILVLVFLTIVVTLPPLYTQWSESERLKQIQTMKQQARPIFGDRLESVLSELKSGESPSVVILYTGGTKSHLEAVWMLSRRVRWTAETCLCRGKASQAWVPNAAGGCWKHL